MITIHRALIIRVLIVSFSIPNHFNTAPCAIISSMDVNMNTNNNNNNSMSKDEMTDSQTTHTSLESKDPGSHIPVVQVDG